MPTLTGSPRRAWFAGVDLSALVKGLLEELRQVSKAESVVGAVHDAGKAKVLPLSRVSIGFGAGTAGAGGKATRGGHSSDAGAEGGGIAGALMVEPRAFVVVDENGTPHLLALEKGKGGVLRRGIEIPRLTNEPERRPALDPKGPLPSLGDGTERPKP